MDSTSSGSGGAILGSLVHGRLVAEAGVAACAPSQFGRIYVDVNGRAQMGIAFANTSGRDALISFYFTDVGGSDFGQGSFNLEANHHFSAFLNQAPFNGGSTAGGTFTFTSSIPVGV